MRGEECEPTKTAPEGYGITPRMRGEELTSSKAWFM